MINVFIQCMYYSDGGVSNGKAQLTNSMGSERHRYNAPVSLRVHVHVF